MRADLSLRDRLRLRSTQPGVGYQAERRLEDTSEEKLFVGRAQGTAGVAAQDGGV